MSLNDFPAVTRRDIAVHAFLTLLCLVGLFCAFGMCWDFVSNIPGPDMGAW